MTKHYVNLRQGRYTTSVQAACKNFQDEEVHYGYVAGLAVGLATKLALQPCHGDFPLGSA
jgi:hypothetical protein